MYSIGKKVVYVASDWSIGVEHRVIKHCVVTKAGKGSIWVDNAHRPEDCLYAVYAYPDEPDCVAFLEEQQAMVARHKKENDEFLAKTYEFNNQLVRDGRK